MANKEAAVLLIDVGRSMWRTKDSHGISHLDSACMAVQHILHSKIIQGRKTDLVSVMLVGTDETDNHVNEANGGYEHITTYTDIEMANLKTLEFVTGGCVKGQGSGDILDGIVVAVSLLDRHCKHLKWAKTIFVLSDFSSPINQADTRSIIQRAISYEVKVNLIGFGFKDDPPPESDKSARAENERFMRSFAESTKGDIFTGSEALSILGSLRTRSVKPTTLIRCGMTLGDPEDQTNSLSFPVWAYSKVKEAKLPSAKKWSRAGAEAAEGSNDAFIGDVAMERTYKVKDVAIDGADPDAAMDGITLEKEDLIRAYKYGKDLIPFSEEDRDAMKLHTIKGFSMLGFIKSSDVSRELLINDPMQLIPDPAAPSEGKRLFEVLASSLQAKDMYALVRYVRINDASPKLGILVPHIGKKIWCAWIQLPFKEDVREYSFTTLAPLLLNHGGSTATQTFHESASASLAADLLSQAGLSQSGESKRRKMLHRIVETTEADRRIDAFIDDMDLMTALDSDDGEPGEAYKPSDLFNPGYQRMYQCIAHRAINPKSKDLPPLDPRFVAGVLPMPELVDKAKRSLEAFKSAFEITKIDLEKEDNRKRFKRGVDNAKELEKDVLNAAASAAADIATSFDNVAGAAVTSVGTADPVSDFKALVSRNDEGVVAAAMNQMAARVIGFIKESIGSQFYGKAVSCLVAMREEGVKRGLWNRYNELMGEVKGLSFDDRYKGFWGVVKKETKQVGLISVSDVAGSRVSDVEAAEFFADAVAGSFIASADAAEEEEEEDLLGMLD
ncbi:X-ray repair cross-complementing protein 5 [Rhizoclosmatium sp. JEL0117]|nr:X-ray repair cross-complementing protein 5 [Rhizoclosmatium sp. JEL0117]